jgi:hypothetical protein
MPTRKQAADARADRQAIANDLTFLRGFVADLARRMPGSTHEILIAVRDGFRKAGRLRTADAVNRVTLAGAQPEEEEP